MNCDNSVPISDIASEVRDLLSGEYVEVDKPNIVNGVLTNPTLNAPSIRGDLLLDTAVKKVLRDALNYEASLDLDGLSAQATQSIAAATDGAMQLIADGSEDVAALALAANGDENTIVTTRTGNTYPSAKKAIKTIFENGGLPATPFSTYAAMTESALVDGDYAIVTNDTDEANGIYVKQGDYFIRQSYSPASDLAKLLEMVAERDEKNLAEFADADGKIYMSINNYGALKLSGLDDDVQTMINDSAAGLVGLNTELSAVKKESGDTAKLIKSNTDGYSSNLVEMTDVDDNTYLTVDSVGGLKLSGLKESAQDMLLKSESTTEKVNATTDILGSNSFAMMLVDENDKLIFGVKNNGDLLTNDKPTLSIKRPYYLRPTVNLHNALQQVSAPVPTNHVPMDFDAPDALLSLTITQPKPCVIDTIYYQDDGVVHPTLLDFYSGFNGHQYWLGITPYHLNDDLFENPFIYVSDDLKNFKQNTDFAQPMAEQPQARDGSSGYNSDIFYTYDFQSNELLVCWRTSRRGTESGSVLSARRTRDGINWSEAEVIYKSQAGESILSPSIVYDHITKKYLLFCIDSESAGLWGISRREANSLNGEWVNKTFGTLDRSVASPWHLDVRYVGRQLVGILNDDRVTNQLYMVKSSDMGLNWDIGVQMITGAQDHAYKATFTPIYDGNQMALQVMWTSNQSATDENKRWRLFSTQTNFITIAGV